MKTLMYVLVRALQRSWHNRMHRDIHWLPTSGAPHPESVSYEMEALKIILSVLNEYRPLFLTLFT